MKSMWPPLAAIFFMTYFYRAGGPWPPRPPLDPLLILFVLFTKTRETGSYLSFVSEFRKCHDWLDTNSQIK